MSLPLCGAISSTGETCDSTRGHPGMHCSTTAKALWDCEPGDLPLSHAVLWQAEQSTRWMPAEEASEPLPGWERIPESESQRAHWQKGDYYARMREWDKRFFWGLIADRNSINEAPTLRDAMQAAEDAALLVALNREVSDAMAKALAPLRVPEGPSVVTKANGAYCLACGGTTSAHRILCPVETPKAEAERPIREGHAAFRARLSRAHENGVDTTPAAMEIPWAYQDTDRAGWLHAPDLDGPPRTPPTAQETWNAPVALFRASVCRKCGQSACMHPRELD